MALEPGRKIVASRRRLTLDEAVDLTLTVRPAVVCIDSPSGWSISGRSRLAERELARLGIQSYRTGPDPGDHPFYRWMRMGFEIYMRLAAAYPLYRGGDPSQRDAEVFPHATACLLAGRQREPRTSKHDFRRQVLRQFGVDAATLRTPDQIDAALAALTGLIALERGHCAVGDPNEGVILLPVRHLPPTPLAHEIHEVAGRRR